MAAVFQTLTPAIAKNVSAESNGANSGAGNVSNGGGGNSSGGRKRRRNRRRRDRS